MRPTIMKCPFCPKEYVRAWEIVESYSVKRSKTASLPGNKTVKKNKQQIIIRDNCTCGKTSEEIQKWYDA